MSGPKISVYNLNQAARANLNSQIRCERDCVACAQQINELLRQAASFCSQIENLITATDLMISRGVAPLIGKEELQKLAVRLHDESVAIRERIEEKKPVISVKYVISEEALAQKQADLECIRKLKKQAEALRNDVDAAIHQGKKSWVAATSEIERSIAADLSEYSRFDDLAPSDDAPTVEELIGKTEKKLILMQKTNNLPERISNEIAQALASLKKVRTVESIRLFNSVTVKNLEIHISEYQTEITQEKENFADNLARYQALCAMLEKVPTIFSYSTEANAVLKKEIEAMELTVIKQHEQQYISECVDQVMADMGYDLIGTRDVKKRNGKRFHNELYTFDEGTAINVTYSADGQITMELGGLSRKDRLPTEEETQVLTEDMKAFCGEFSEFEMRLRSKGIVIGNRIKMSPPSADYAAIINVNDYNITADKQFSEISVEFKKKTKTTDKKVMRRNN